MAYHTNIYLFLFLPIVLLLYQLAPQKMRWKVLLLSSYVFFWTISGKLVLYLMGMTAFTYYMGIRLAKLGEQGKLALAECAKEEKSACKKKYKRLEKRTLIFGIVVLVGVLAYLKYYNFFALNANRLLNRLEAGFNVPGLPVWIPIGISFYTLEAIGYMTDVYWKKIPAERHLGKLALFLGFFPQLMEGPIALYSDTAENLWKCESLKRENLLQGGLRILWGLFKKIVIADRLYLLVEKVFDNPRGFSGVLIVVAAVAYTIQLYMEFSGCMDIIIGSGNLFGVTLPENFRQPFAARSAAEFWRRWHITLGVWFKTYIFYPVSVSGLVKKWNQFGKKHLSKYWTKLGVSALALFPVWFCNGLWHGARWSYLFYGMYYFVILLAEVAAEPLKKSVLDKLRISEDAGPVKAFQILKTWIIIFVGELFFRANGLKAGFLMFGSIFHDFKPENLWNGTMLYLGLGTADYIIIILGCILVAVVGSMKERKVQITERITNMKLPVRWCIYYALIFAVIIFGAYGEGYLPVELIYAGF